MKAFRCKNCGSEVHGESAPAACSCGARDSFAEVDFSSDSKCAHCRGCH